MLNKKNKNFAIDKECLKEFESHQRQEERVKSIQEYSLLKKLSNKRARGMLKNAETVI